MFTLSDYQIVNGCQTSHIVFANQSSLRDDTSVPVKIIEAEDRELVNEIVRATNRQTVVTEEAFVVLGEFHKRLERFFLVDSTDEGHKLVYERRKRQYADTAYTAQNITSLSFITNAVVSCLMENPVDAIDYYGVLLRRYNEKIFSDKHSLWPYLLSAVILREVEKLCVGKARVNIWKFRFVIASVIRIRFGALPDLRNDNAQRKYCGEALLVCRNPALFFERVMEAERLMALAVERMPTAIDERNAQQDRKFVEAVLALARQSD